MAMGIYPMDCSICSQGTESAERFRADWGCDTDTPHDLDRYPCGCGRWPDCTRCNGTGTIGLKRCPRKFIDPYISTVIRYVAYARDGHWPVAGGILDQSQSFLDAHAVVVGEIQTIENADG